MTADGRSRRRTEERATPFESRRRSRLLAERSRHSILDVVVGSADATAFAFVMATGIDSVGAALVGLRLVSDVLLGAACAVWLTLVALLAPESTARPRPEAFAAVAATAVLGARWAQLGRDDIALALWLLAAGVWLGVTARRPRGARAGGGSFLAVVGTESLAVLAALLAPRFGKALLDVALAFWLLGLCLYPVVARAVAVELRRRPRFAPELWIAMGALAIVTVAGAELYLAARWLEWVAPVRHALHALVVATWALASVAIVPLVVAELRARSWSDPFGRWSFVFPLGMYALATHLVGRTSGVALLGSLGRIFAVVALLAWCLVLLGHALRRLQPVQAG